MNRHTHIAATKARRAENEGRGRHNDKSVTQSSVESGLLHNGWLPVNILPIAQEWSENWVDRTKADAFVSEAKRTSHEAAARLKRLTEEMLERNASIMPSLRIS